MKGQVVKVISDLFYCLVDDKIIICHQRGLLKKNKTLPLVGDFVLINMEKKVIEKILDRKNEILRPSVANIDQAFIITSLVCPDFSTNLLDKLITQLELNNIDVVICLTKRDLLDDKDKYLDILNYYKKIGYPVIYNDEQKKIKELLKGKVTVFTGQTGAGKSTLLNKLFLNLNLKTGEVSTALGRGRHTTRHTEIIMVDDIKVLDTPGFSALTFENYKKDLIKNAFIEFNNFPCIYNDCMHDLESECNVKKAVLNNKILKSRYENYLSFIKGMNNR